MMVTALALRRLRWGSRRDARLRGGVIARPMAAGRAKGQDNFNATMRRPGSCGLIVPPALLARADEVIE
jgi:hypothetical protein